MTKIGKLGEQLVAQWLEAQGWLILHHRWYCLWGEIDLIAQPKSSEILVFVEVKTRSRGNWDADGLLAITLQKQAKLCRTAAQFLAEYPDLANLPCRFDVALVNYRRSKQPSNYKSDRHYPNQSITIGQPIFWEGYQFILHNYIESAFDGN
ncbi:MAG: YraN family protein [Xenococcaceae cyanobacterium]